MFWSNTPQMYLQTNHSGICNGTTVTVEPKIHDKQTTSQQTLTIMSDVHTQNQNHVFKKKNVELI